MTDTTTIEITTEQKEQLDNLKAVDSEAYKNVIARLLDGYSNAKSEDTSDVSGELADIQNELEDIRSELRTLTH